MFKTKLPGDYARCCNEDCPSKDKCLRYLDRMNGDVFAVFCAGENERCEDFIASKPKKRDEHK